MLRSLASKDLCAFVYECNHFARLHYPELFVYVRGGDKFFDNVSARLFDRLTINEESWREAGGILYNSPKRDTVGLQRLLTSTTASAFACGLSTKINHIDVHKGFFFNPHKLDTNKLTLITISNLCGNDMQTIQFINHVFAKPHIFILATTADHNKLKTVIDNWGCFYQRPTYSPPRPFTQ